MSRRLNTKETKRAIKQWLAHNIRPIHYTEAEKRLSIESYGEYSKKTNRAEKIRQLFAEHDNGVLVSNGYLFLETWFHGPQRFLYEPSNIMTNVFPEMAFNAGYELAKREPYMMDWQNNRGSKKWYMNRRTGFLVETAVRHYFSTRWPNMYRPPSNIGSYERAAKDDFSLVLSDRTIIVDVKQENERGDAYVRNPQDYIVYIIARWLPQEHAAQIIGMTTGVYLMPAMKGLIKVGTEVLLPVEMLICALEMDVLGMNYWHVSESMGISR